LGRHVEEGCHGMSNATESSFKSRGKKKRNGRGKRNGLTRRERSKGKIFDKNVHEGNHPQEYLGKKQKKDALTKRKRGGEDSLGRIPNGLEMGGERQTGVRKEVKREAKMKTIRKLALELGKSRGVRWGLGAVIGLKEWCRWDAPLTGSV